MEQPQEVTMLSLVPCNVCNLDLIYNSEYKYSLPQNVLEGFLSGKAFDNKENYTQEESENLSKILMSFTNRSFQLAQLKKR